MEYQLLLPKEKIAEFCQKWQICEFAVFGSALRSDFNQESDIDVLVTFKDEAKHTLFHLVRMKRELQLITGRNVDIVTRKGIESSRNRIRKKEILDSARKVYAT